MTDREYWDRRYAGGGNSGAGSYGTSLYRKLQWLSGLPGISTIVELGCGDFNFGDNLMDAYPGSQYLGLDISDEIVRKNNTVSSTFAIQFKIIGPADPIPSSDLLLCLDVLFHISDDREYEDMIARLQSATWKYLAITAYEYDDLETGRHVRIRKFDPSTFGTPIKREVIEENGQMYFYLFQR